jgi:hypothetical protein
MNAPIPRETNSPRQLSAKQLSEILVAVLTRCRHRAGEDEWDAIEEALRRLAEHKRLVRRVLPALRDRLAPTESGSGTGNPPRPGPDRATLMARLTAPRRRGMIPGVSRVVKQSASPTGCGP